MGCSCVLCRAFVNAFHSEACPLSVLQDDLYVFLLPLAIRSNLLKPLITATWPPPNISILSFSKDSSPLATYTIFPTDPSPNSIVIDTLSPLYKCPSDKLCACTDTGFSPKTNVMKSTKWHISPIMRPPPEFLSCVQCSLEK